MVERVVERRKEPEPGEIPHEVIRRDNNEKVLARQQGRVVIKARDVPFRQSRQALSRHYSYPGKWCVAGEWIIINQRLATNSGRHQHQGGLGLFCWKGKGYSVVDEVRYDWEKDDLLLLPIKPDGCMHQHFNAEPEKGPAELVVFIFWPVNDAVAVKGEQSQEHPDWKAPTPAAPHGA